MKRFVTAPVVALLLIVLLFTSGCTSGPPPSSVITCFGDIGIKVVTSIVSEDAPLTGIALLSVVPECINAAIAVFSAPANATPSSPEVDIKQSPNDGTSSGSVNSNTWSNCTDYAQTLRFDFSVPFKMIVGQSPNQSEFNSSPGGTSDNELVARQVFQQYGSYIASVTTSGPSQSELLTVPAQTKVTLTLPITLHYREGEARVVHTDGSTVSLPWLFTNGYEQAGRITGTTSSC